ncbi:stress-response A/B barrel domain-containing protein HS1-like [Salvia miltiorrhiza]|uniref:stress-response A/B barrel domain-containing protein HS1-like n=1 Tax=Salvia miltiorrhiza TaxID=226208 RepID=UPI0025AD5B97|nr:stress-response A/B barrel domain-containing protein HS1-like [Salvia miltiorrhiza]
MEESKREVKHIVLAKFKEGLSKEEIEECIKQFANLVDLVPSMKAFKWGKELSIINFHQGFTHVFESIFETTKGVEDYLSDQNHVDYGNFLMPQLDKFLIIDFEPTKVQP